MSNTSRGCWRLLVRGPHGRQLYWMHVSYLDGRLLTEGSWDRLSWIRVQSLSRRTSEQISQVHRIPECPGKERILAWTCEKCPTFSRNPYNVRKASFLSSSSLWSENLLKSCLSRDKTLAPWQFLYLYNWAKVLKMNLGCFIGIAWALPMSAYGD